MKTPIPITIELAREIANGGEFVAFMPTHFKTPTGTTCDLALAIYNYKFYVVMIAEIEGKICLMKEGHFEINKEMAKEGFGNQVNFVDFEIQGGVLTIPKEFSQN